MSEGMTIRDPDEMEKFAAEVETYCAEMKATCNNLKSSLSSAESGMKDRVSKKHCNVWSSWQKICLPACS